MRMCFSKLRIVPACLVVACLLCPCRGMSQAGVRTSGGGDEAATSAETLRASSSSVTIPGPLRSFLRMAAISQQVSSEDVLPLLARNVVVDGYQGRGEGGKPTEYLLLLRRYVQQARELVALAGPVGVIRVANCEAAGPLLKVLGFRLMRPCGPSAAVETEVPERAFLTIDSGFPLTELEATLQGGKAFAYPYPAFQVPVILAPDAWTNLEKSKGGRGEVLDCLLSDPNLARLYWAMSRIDARTRAYLLHSPGLSSLLPTASVLDFYGSNLSIRSGRVEVPGGVPAEPAWENLVGASPDSPGEFVTRLLKKDAGWLAAYFDALSRVSASQQAYFAAPQRLERFYTALRGRVIYPGPAQSVFRPDAGLLLLVARLQFEPDGQPHIPGNLEVWRDFLRHSPDAKLSRRRGRRVGDLKNSEQLLEAMFAFSRVYSTPSPLEIFLMMSELDRGRTASERLSPQTAKLLVDDYPRFGGQYRVFCEFRKLDNGAITDFLRAADALDRMSNRALRADAIGLSQATLGFWQTLARQGEVPPAAWSDSWRRVVNPFAHVHSTVDLFDTARTSLADVMRAATGKSRLSQDEFISVLAAPHQSSPEGEQVAQELANRIRSAYEGQRLVPIDTLLTLGDGLVAVSQGKADSSTLLPLIGEVQEFQLPKPLFSSAEKSEWTAGLLQNLHLDVEMKTDLRRVIKTARSPKELAAARGLLVPFLRDSLVGLNYALYAPPGTQLLANNPLLVRSHDFSGEGTEKEAGSWATPTLEGRGWTAAGGAHLAGSLADLPYVLAELEEDFLVPENVQALIWEDLVPTLLAGSVLPHWWQVSVNELHALALYQRFGEDLLHAAGRDENLRARVMSILTDRLPPQRFEEVEEALDAERATEALPQLAPAETFYLGTEFHRRFPQELGAWGKAGLQLQTLAKENPEAVSRERLSEDFGVPHPAYAQTYACELLPLKPLPTYLGYSSRLLAESWDSNNLYWARLADELGYPPVMLNLLAPELTRRMAAKIFATHLEDWSALLRALRQTGEEFRQGKIAAAALKSRVAPGG